MGKSFLETLLAWLEQQHGPWAYGALGISAGLEYLAPPLPGDTITIFGVFLSIAAHYKGWAVYGVLIIGSIAGADAAYVIGRRLSKTHHEGRIQKFLTQPAVLHTIEKLKHNAGWVLVTNRFVPGLRGVVFVAAGVARLSRIKVALYGGLSAAIWNGILFALGMSLGTNWRKALEYIETYSKAVTLILVSVVIFWVFLKVILPRLRK